MKRADFKIDYAVKDITIENQFAFVEAFAATAENRISDSKPVQKRSIGFFCF